MRLRNRHTYVHFLWFICANLLLNFSCNKDRDLFLDSILDKDSIEVNQEETATAESNDTVENNTIVSENTSDENKEDVESRITDFPTINDAYLQNGLGYDIPIVRLQENIRTSYLMFNLSEIDSIGGTILSAELEFIINEDDGNGIIEVYKGMSNNWSEKTLSNESAPQNGTLMGAVEQQFQLNSTVTIELNIAEINPTYSTLILVHKGDNDLAFASQENPNYLGPKLIVGYEAEVGAKEIEIVQEQEISEVEENNIEPNTEEEVTGEDESAEEETTEENVDQEEATEEATDEEVNENETDAESENNAPIAVASANATSGDAPLTVNFVGGNSSDDKGIASYYWDYPGDPSAAPNNTRTFTNPGVYQITLTVKDAEGLISTDTLTITVNETVPEDISGQIQCSTGGGKANEIGSKIWCWNDVAIPNYNGKTTIFSNGQLGIDSECNENQITKVGDQLRFYLNPETPDPQGWCNNAFNMRAEVYTAPWRVNNPLGTEEWMGWSYTFGNNYKPDNQNPWLFFQMHQGVAGTPPVELAVVPSRLYGAQTGEVVVINYANKTETDRTKTGVVPQAGTTLDIVVNVIHGLGSNGLLRIWINGNKVYDKQVGTVYSHAPWGGNAKFGIYNWSWRDESAVQNSLQQGIDHLETFMGPLRMITRYPGDSNYGTDSYIEVAPD